MDNIAYLGVDCSSKAIHAVWIDENENIILQQKWGSKHKDFLSRFHEFGETFWDEISTINYTLNSYGGLIARVEAPIFIQNPKATISIASVTGLVWFLCKHYGIKCSYVDNTKWKKDIVGKGNASKKEIKEYAIEKWGEVFPEQDFADAACIALWAKQEEQNESR